MRYRWRPSSTAQLPFQQLLENNDLGIIDNPLRRIPEKHLREFIDSFFKESELAKVTNFTNLFRGARLARDEEAFGQEDTLTDVEKAALEKEKSRDPEEDPNKDRRREPSLWAESREIKIILLICCVASITQGWVREAVSLFCGAEGQMASAKHHPTSERMLISFRLKLRSLAPTRDGQGLSISS